MEILETFPRVFCFPTSHINENGGNKVLKNTPLRFICQTLFLVFGNVVKHGLSCLIYYLLSTKQYFVIQSPSEKKVRLSGYGVELAVKKTEYKAVDDSKVQDDTEGKVQKTDEADDDEVEGFLFGKLRFVQHSMFVLRLQFGPE